MTWWVAWLCLAIFCIGFETITTELVAVWFAFSALITCIVVAIFPQMEIVWQLLIFIILSVALLLATRPLVKKLLKRKKDQDTNLELVLKHRALVIEDINNDLEQGSIKINGLVWTARSENGNLIAKDALVTVVRIQGNKAIVKEEK